MGHRLWRGVYTQTHVMGGAGVGCVQPREWGFQALLRVCVCARARRVGRENPVYICVYGDIYNRGIYTCTENICHQPLNGYTNYTKTLKGRGTSPIPPPRKPGTAVLAQPVPSLWEGGGGGDVPLPPEQTAASKCTPTSQKEVR